MTQQLCYHCLWNYRVICW